MPTVRGENESRWKPQTILVIDHDPWVRAMIHAAFDERDYNIVTASNGRAGLRVALVARPQLVFLGLTLPEVSGVTVLRTLKGQHGTRNVPVVILQRDEPTMPLDQAQAVAGILTYPFSTQEVRDQVRWVVRRAQFPHMAHPSSRGGASPPVTLAHADHRAVLQG